LAIFGITEVFAGFLERKILLKIISIICSFGEIDDYYKDNIKGKKTLYLTIQLKYNCLYCLSL